MRNQEKNLPVQIHTTNFHGLDDKRRTLVFSPRAHVMLLNI